MADGTKIEWTDATWNPVTGCAVVSPGCTNCYAMRLAGTRLRHIASRAGLTRDSKAGPVWTGETRLNKAELRKPLRWRRPRRIFVCAHGELFAESVPDDWIDRVFAVMALAPQHTFQLLTKRARQMREYMTAPRVADRVYDIVCDEAMLNRANVTLLVDAGLEKYAPPGPRVVLGTWPLRNVWLGVSAEDQTRADERIPDLLATPAAVRWVSAEPLLGPIDFARVMVDGDPRLDWIVVGGESGAGARPMHPAWARSIRDQCAEAGVPFFMKQMSGATKRAMPTIPDDLMIREYPNVRGAARTAPVGYKD